MQKKAVRILTKKLGREPNESEVGCHTRGGSHYGLCDDYHEKHARGTKEGQMEATQVPNLMTM